VVICPPFAEKEKGFGQWLRKMSRLSQELTIPLLFHCDRKSRLAIIETLKTSHSTSPVLYEVFKNFREWEDIASRKLHFREDDIVTFVCARRESISYKPFFDLVPEQLEKHVKDISKIMIYPEQFDSAIIEEEYADVVAPKSFPFGASTIRKIREEISGFMKKNQLQIRKKARGKTAATPKRFGFSRKEP
jgi:hypothetical protein